jgi:hypothetical protein
MKNIWMKKKSKHAGLAQQNGFGRAFWHTLPRLTKTHNKA